MKIGIVSLGLIGGSIFKVLIEKGYEVAAVTRNKAAIAEAKKYSPYISDNIEDLKDCNVIFVCSPMSATLDILDILEKILPSETIVADVCSLKEFVMNKKRPYAFIGTHPMAGTEHSGFDASFKELFEGAKWILTPFDDTPESSLEKLLKIIKDTGAIPITTNAKDHDAAAALISHMPMVLAQALMKTAMNNPLALKIASSGFRDMTRLALSNTVMANDMVCLNNENIKKMFDSFINNTQSLLSEDYSAQIEQIKDCRSKMYNSEGKNICN